VPSILPRFAQSRQTMDLGEGDDPSMNMLESVYNFLHKTPEERVEINEKYIYDIVHNVVSKLNKVNTHTHTHTHTHTQN
jgi:hypothetical protein